MSTAEDIKEAHEAFVSGYSGSSAPDVILAIYPAIPGSVAACIIGQGRSGKIWLLIEGILIALPLILSFTYLANYTLEISGGMAMVAVLAVSFIPKTRNHSDVNCEKRLGLLTSQRALLSLVTAIAILAVDFHSFPRR
ncbi:hypothetical protein SK128_007388 [Halocaridina rubra]|uniref:Uncharacterized protein n=1 Tax=Halocaridina rubra TaxID=373956 RepID=A0AAN9A6E8_HALRR